MPLVYAAASTAERLVVAVNNTSRGKRRDKRLLKERFIVVQFDDEDGCLFYGSQRRKFGWMLLEMERMRKGMLWLWSRVIVRNALSNSGVNQLMPDVRCAALMLMRVSVSVSSH